MLSRQTKCVCAILFHIFRCVAPLQVNLPLTHSLTNVILIISLDRDPIVIVCYARLGWEFNKENKEIENAN